MSDIIPDEIDLVSISGGEENLLRYAADPKAELVQMILENLGSNSGRGDYKDMGKVDALVTLLCYQGKGFNSITVDGDWTPVLTRQGKKSTITQKVVGKREKANNSFSNFDVKDMIFVNLAYTPRGNGLIKAEVKVRTIHCLSCFSFSCSLHGGIGASHRYSALLGTSLVQSCSSQFR